MDLPARVEATLDGEEVAASVALGSDDMLYVTPSRTLIYRGEGFLSNDSVEAFPHSAQRIDVDVRRRKATIRLDYGIDGEREFSVPSDVLDTALHPVVAGVLNAAGVTTGGETVLETHRFSELTLVVTSHRVVKHVGEAVWDEEFEEVPYEALTRVALEEGSVASQLVLESQDRTQRIKVPQDQAPRVHQHVVDAVCEYYGVSSYEAFEELVAEREADQAEGTVDEEDDGGFVDEGLDLIETKGSDAADAAPASTQTKGREESDTEEPVDGVGVTDIGTPTTEDDTPSTEPRGDASGARADDGDEFTGSPFESATHQHVDQSVEARIKDLEASLEEQARLIEDQRDILLELVEELNRRDR